MSRINRRKFIKVSAGAAAATAIWSSWLQDALAVEANNATRSIRDVEHIVILMQENRSFDHYFGTLAGVRGFGDPDALKLSDGKSVFYQPDTVNPNGYLLPFHLDTHSSSAQKIPSTGHAWAVQYVGALRHGG